MQFRVYLCLYESKPPPGKCNPTHPIYGIVVRPRARSVDVDLNKPSRKPGEDISTSMQGMYKPKKKLRVSHKYFARSII